MRGSISRQLAVLPDESRRALLEPEHGIYEVVPKERLLPLITIVHRQTSQLGITLSGYVAQLVAASRLLQTDIATTNPDNIPRWARDGSGLTDVRWQLIKPQGQSG